MDFLSFLITEIISIVLKSEIVIELYKSLWEPYNFALIEFQNNLKEIKIELFWNDLLLEIIVMFWMANKLTPLMQLLVFYCGSILNYNYCFFLAGNPWALACEIVIIFWGHLFVLFCLSAESIYILILIRALVSCI
jgi:hypothetical protein